MLMKYNPEVKMVEMYKTIYKSRKSTTYPSSSLMGSKMDWLLTLLVRMGAGLAGEFR